MVLRELLRLINKIRKCHPDANNADVWAVDDEGNTFHVNYVGFDKRHKPNRIKLEQ